MQKRRKGEPFAATRVPAGTDVDFGALTRQLFAGLREKGVEVVTNHEVKKEVDLMEVQVEQQDQLVDQREHQRLQLKWRNPDFGDILRYFFQYNHQRRQLWN